MDKEIASPVSLRIARNLIEFAERDFPAETYRRARAAISDTIGVSLAAVGHPGAEMMRSVILPTAAAGRSTLFGSSERINALDAALLNGLYAHMLDFDDSNSHLFGHPSAAILPALIALADQVGATGQEILHAYICGFEAGARFGNAFSRFEYTHGWHPTTSIGIFSAVSACATLIGLDAEKTAMAYGIATHMSSGIKSNFGSMTKPFGVGHANRNALTAVLLAERGFTSGALAFEHHHGFYQVYNCGEENCDPEPLLVTPWDDFLRILDCKKGIKQKRYPCCYACLPVLDGIQEISVNNDLPLDEIEAIEIEVNPIRFPHINVPDPSTPLEAKFSVHYCVARALLTGGLAAEDFEEGPAFTDAATRALMARVSFSTYDWDNPSGAIVKILKKNGQVHESIVEAALGSTYDHALSDEDMRVKFMTCTRRVLGDRKSEVLYSALMDLDAQDDIRKVTELTMVTVGNDKHTPVLVTS